MEELWHFNVHVGSRASRSAADVHSQTFVTFLVVNLRMSKPRQVASSLANRKLPGGVPTAVVTPTTRPTT